LALRNSIEQRVNRAVSWLYQVRSTRPKPPTKIAEEQRALPPVELKKSLILCTDERTGSHHLAALLASTGVLGRAYEYFNGAWMQLHYPEYPGGVLQQLEWAKRLGTTANGVFSIKLHPWAMDRISPYVDIGRDLPEPRFVLLQRKDVLGQAISLYKAHQTGVYTSGGWVPERGRPSYNGDDILKLVQSLLVRQARWEAYFARNGITALRLDYDDIVSSPHRCVYQISRLAGIAERAIIGRATWYRFDRQSDEINEAWREQFIADFSGTGHLDVIRAEALCDHNG
jgi:LPS sulfotransferase NodH